MNNSLFDQLQSGVCTFLGLPLVLGQEKAWGLEGGHRERSSQAAPPDSIGAVIGAPFDGGVIHRPGARMGPWALRSASLGLGSIPMPARMCNTNYELPSPNRSWVDGGNIPTLPFSNEGAVRVVAETLGAWARQGRTLMLGGDHLATLGALEAHSRIHGPLGLLHLDAHMDATDPALWGGAMHHGNWLRFAIMQGFLAPERIVQIGIRAPRHDDEELRFIKSAGARIWTPLDVKDLSLYTQLQGEIARVGMGPCYVSLDLDVLDPAFCPAVAEPVPGGLSTLELIQLLRLTKKWERPWVGADVMELAPDLDGGGISATVGAHLAMHLIS